jgi:Uncharacterized protein conserved in bacteria C-term(DUF2220)
MNPAAVPIGQALYRLWHDARGHRTEPATRAFARAWELLLEEAGIVAAADRQEAWHDVRALAAAGLVRLHSPPYRPDVIERIAIPVEAEARWQAAFGFVPPSTEEAAALRTFPWVPALAFVRELRLGVPLSDLRALNAFFAAGPTHGPVVPVKERSLQLFGDEKRLDPLLNSALFGPGRLSLADLQAECVAEPLGWSRGPSIAGDRPILVLENLATWHSFRTWNRRTARFSAVVYGGGNRFMDSVRWLPELFEELGGHRPIFYFGDLDPHGVRIPSIAAARAQTLGLPELRPELDCYRQLLQSKPVAEQPSLDDTDATAWIHWLGPCAEPALALFQRGKRLAQEHIGLEHLMGRDRTE